MSGSMAASASTPGRHPEAGRGRAPLAAAVAVSGRVASRPWQQVLDQPAQVAGELGGQPLPGRWRQRGRQPGGRLVVGRRRAVEVRRVVAGVGPDHRQEEGLVSCCQPPSRRRRRSRACRCAGRRRRSGYRWRHRPRTGPTSRPRPRRGPWSGWPPRSSPSLRTSTSTSGGLPAPAADRRGRGDRTSKSWRPGKCSASSLPQPSGSRRTGPGWPAAGRADPLPVAPPLEAAAQPMSKQAHSGRGDGAARCGSRPEGTPARVGSTTGDARRPRTGHRR